MHTGYETWFGDIYIDDTLARVALGDNAVWSAVRHYEMQKIISWSATQIEIEMNVGTFATSENAWFFVIDANGDASGGELVVIGQGNEGGAELTAPTNLTAEKGP